MSRLAEAAPLLRGERATGASLFNCLLWGQGLYYAATGVWPLVDLASFERVTGPKTDGWLVLTVAVLIVAVGLTLLVAAWRGRRPIEVALLAVASAVGLTAIDVVYVSRGTIEPIYLADAAAEGVLILGWLFTLLATDWRPREA